MNWMGNFKRDKMQFINSAPKKITPIIFGDEAEPEKVIKSSERNQ